MTSVELEAMGRAYFAQKEVVYELLVANRDEQRKNIALWQSLNHERAIPSRYFPQCILDATGLIQAENLDDLRDALNEFVLGTPGAFERIQHQYQIKMSLMNEPIRLLQDALVEAELERNTLINLQHAMDALKMLKEKWKETC